MASLVPIFFIFSAYDVEEVAFEERQELGVFLVGLVRRGLVGVVVKCFDDLKRCSARKSDMTVNGIPYLLWGYDGSRCLWLY